MAGADRLIPDDLVRAVANSDVEAVRLALGQAPELIRATTKGSHETLLHLAASFGSLEIVELLVAAGAELNAEAALDYYPLDSARRTEHWEIFDFLKSKGAKEYC